jgi:3'-phosphoadenosine 5'-phosphosulfate sulfotransferase (PAPS reductase)/FAD synthetase
MSKVRHVLGISGGKDSAALAIYLKKKYPQLDIKYYFCDTGKELKETYRIIENLEVFLGKKITRLSAAKGFPGAPFDYYYDLYRGYLPSARARWCTKKLKLEPFEEFVGNDPVISYVAIRGDEDREGYISKKPNIQSIFPFRKNIWSEDVTGRILDNKNIDSLSGIFRKKSKNGKIAEMASKIVCREISPGFTKGQKLNELLSLDIVGFNRVVFEFLKTTQYPLSYLEEFPLLDNEDVLTREDIFNILEENGVGIPEYYKSIEFTVNGKKGNYARSRSGCFFCFFQQKIEWVWLYEQHPDLFKEAMEYEKMGFTWKQDEKLEDLIKPERIKQIKKDHMKKNGSLSRQKSGLLIDILSTAEEEGCAACFI